VIEHEPSTLPADAPRPSVACVFLTMGDRPEELERAIRSVQDQLGDPIEVIVVCNGVPAPKLPDPMNGTVSIIELPDNAGIPGGRNAGIQASHSELVMFLDDDGWLADQVIVERLRDRFIDDPRLGIVSLRIADPDSGLTQRRHVPRLEASDPERTSEVTTFLGGASIVRRKVFDEAGLLPEKFFYGHEETDLAWRALDAGWRIWYDARCVLYHPATSPTRHPAYFRLNARNRVWLAKRNLPVPLAVVYLLTWILVTHLRVHSRAGLAAWWSGFFDGLRSSAGERRPMHWSTAWRMTRLRRPPIV
jgi:GT2 family glycosyltransferase